MTGRQNSHAPKTKMRFYPHIALTFLNSLTGKNSYLSIMAKVTRCVRNRCQHQAAIALWILTLLVLWCALHHGGLFSPFTSNDVISHSLAAGYLVLLRASFVIRLTILIKVRQWFQKNN